MAVTSSTGDTSEDERVDEERGARDEIALHERAAANYAWEYFKYHAQQRQAVFRFYLLLSGAIFAGLLATFVGGGPLHGGGNTTPSQVDWMRPIFGAALATFSFLFWRLDVRSYQLVKLSEDYLKLEEHRLSGFLRGPAREKILIIEKSDQRSRYFPSKYLASFRTVYACIFIIIGAVGLIICHKILFIGFILIFLQWLLIVKAAEFD